MNSNERQAWLAERQKGIGATDAAAICGVGYRTPAEVYAEKTATEPPNDEGSPIMRMGLATEHYNAQLYAERTGRRLIAPGMMWSDVVPWRFATLDRLACDAMTRGIPDGTGRSVEMKYTRFFGDAWGPDGSEIVPDGYVVQTHWQTGVLRDNGHNLTVSDISALESGGEHRVFTLPYDFALAGIILEICREFWNCVQNRIPITADWRTPFHDQLTDQIAAILPDTAVDLSSEAIAIVAEIDHFTTVKKQGEAAEEQIREYKRQLRVLLDGAEVGLLPDGRRVKQYHVPAATITPKPYEREERFDVRILAAPRAKQKGRSS